MSLAIISDKKFVHPLSQVKSPKPQALFQSSQTRFYCSEFFNASLQLPRSIRKSFAVFDHKASHALISSSTRFLWQFEFLAQHFPWQIMFPCFLAHIKKIKNGAVYLFFLDGSGALFWSSVCSVIFKRTVPLLVSTPCTTLHLKNVSALSASARSSAIFEGSVSFLCFANSVLILCLPASKACKSPSNTLSLVLWSNR